MFDEPADLPELREHIRARRAALAGFMEQGCDLALEGDLLRVIPRNDIYIRYLNDNRTSIGELASDLYGRELRVVVELKKPDQKVAQKPEESSSTSVDPAEFVARIVKPGPDGWLEVRAIKDRKVILQSHCRGRRKFRTEVQGAVERGADIYFGVAARANDKGGKLDDCRHLAALFTDIDYKMTPELEALELLERFALRPSAIINTGGGLHAYWVLVAAVPLAGESVARIGLLLRKLTVAVGGDLGAAEPARVLRIPGTQNHKYDPPRTVELRHFDPTISYSLEQIEAALASIEDPRARASSSNGSSLNGAPFELPNEIGEGERNPMLFALARSLHHKLGSTELLAVLRSVNAIRCKPPVDDAELEQIARNASVEPDRADFNNGGPQTQTAQAETFLDYHNVGEVRDKLASFDARLRADINTAYETDYATAAAALEHFEPAEFQRLLNTLKAKGISITRWEHTVKEYGRNERLRIAEARKTSLKQTRAAEKNRRGQGQVLEFAEPEPAAEADGIGLAQDIADELKRFVIVNPHQRVAIVLWVLFSYLIDVFDFAPRLAITSPEMGCGKSTLVEFLSCLAYRAIACSSISSAAIYRIIEMFKPTLLMDEQDLKKGQPDEGAEERRKVLNSGHKRSTAFVIRVVGDDLEPRRFSTFTPIAHASIGEVQATLMDRAVPIAMQRKTPGERVESMRSSGKDARRNAVRLVEIKGRIVKWTSDHRDAIAQAEPGLPQALSSRQADNWSPLVAIADCLGDEWGALARTAAVAISGKNTNDRTIGVLLLKDLRELFQQQAGIQRKDLREMELSSAFIVEKLGEMEERPWSEWGRNRKPITPRQLAVLLSPFAIVPVKLRIGESTPNGYRFKAFEDVFSRYTLTPEDSNRNTGTTAGGVCENGDFGSGTEAGCSGSENGTSAYAEKKCAVAPDEKLKRGVGPATNDAKASEGMEF